MKCIAIDKDAKALQQLCAFIEKDANLQLQKTFDSSTEAQKYLLDDKNKVQVVFVEADMPELSGIDLAKSLMTKPAVIVLSSNKDKAYDAYKAKAIDYILKPLSFEDYTEAVRKASLYNKAQETTSLEQARSSKFVSNDRFIFIKSEYKVMRIDLDKIKYVESMREYVRFHIEDSRPIMSLLTIKAVENYLPKTKFMRVHRSYIVNLDKINVIERARIVFDGDTFIPISEQYKEKFQDYLDVNFAQ